MNASRGIRILLIILLCGLVSCSGKSALKPPERFDAEKAFQLANEQLENKEYEKARAGFLEVRNRDLSKKFAPLAQLKIADSYQKEEQYDIAVVEYRKFLDNYPDFQYAPYAQYQIAMIYFNQIESPERGYGGAAKALEEFKRMKTLYPRNPYKEIIELRVQQCKNLIADYEYLVGEFYFKKGSYKAALGRFEGLIENYPDYGYTAKVLYYTGIAHKGLAQREKAQKYFTQVIKQYPNTTFAADAQEELASLSK
jgi:outer membrane protein assembly factor BamD